MEGKQFSTKDFIDSVKGYVFEKGENQTEPRLENEVETQLETVQITVSDIIDYSLSKDWFHGTSLTTTNESSIDQGFSNRDINSCDSRKFIIFHCCEELELLSRDYSNDEGGDGSVAVGPQTDIDIEHPDYLIQKGLAQSALHRIPLPQPDWDHALPEHTPGLLQKAFIDVFKTGDADPFQERPRSIQQPKTTWQSHYLLVYWYI